MAGARAGKEIPMSALTAEKTLTRASKEWFSRPDDERYLSLDDLYEATHLRAHQSRVRTDTTRSLLVRGSEVAGGRLTVEHNELGELDPTHWSLGQLATAAHTPAKWLREIATVPAGPAFAAHALNLGLRHLAASGRVQLMSRTEEHGPGARHLELRCLVGPDYGRIYDHEVVRAVRELNADGRWRVPAASYSVQNPKRATTLYASDRDVFIFLVDDQNPVSFEADGVKRNLFRGFMVWNSEVGSRTFGLTTFLYNFVCDNRIVWGATDVRELTIIHKKNAAERFAKEALPHLRAYADSSVREVEAQLTRAANLAVTEADSDAKVLDWLRYHHFTKKEGEAVIEMAKIEEGGARTLWQLVQGGTALARAIPHADERISFEYRISGLLSYAERE
jgi:hypothetical protein